MNKNKLEELGKKVDRARELQHEIEKINLMLQHLTYMKGTIAIREAPGDYIIYLEAKRENLSPLVEILEERKKACEQEIESL